MFWVNANLTSWRFDQFFVGRFFWLFSPKVPLFPSEWQPCAEGTLPSAGDRALQHVSVQQAALYLNAQDVPEMCAKQKQNIIVPETPAKQCLLAGHSVQMPGARPAAGDWGR